MGHIKNEPVIRDPVQLAYVIERRVKYIFTPLFCPTIFVKSSDQCFEKKATAGERIFGSFFSKIYAKIVRFLVVFNGFLAVFQCLHN